MTATTLSIRTLTALLFALHATTVNAQPILPEAPAAALTMDPSTMPLLTQEASNIGPLTTSMTGAIQIAAGTSAGTPINANLVPRGRAGFKGFDMRPNEYSQDYNFPIQGFSSMPVWSQTSVDASMTTSSLGYAANAVSGAVSSSEEASQKVHVEDKVKLSFFGFDAEQSFGYDSSTSTSSNTVSAYTYIHAAISGLMLGMPENLVLSDDAQNMLTAGNIDQFIDTYGTHFVKTLNYGCDASAIYQYQCQTSEASKSISAGLQAGYFGQSADVKTKVDNYVKTNTCKFNTYWNTLGAVDGIQLPNSNQMTDPNVMGNFFSKFAQQCNQQAAGQGQLLYVTLGNWLEVPAVLKAIGANQDAKNFLSFWGAMDQASMQNLGKAGRYLSMVQQTLDKLDDPKCAGALNPWAKTGLFDRDGGVTDSQPSNDYWNNLAQRHADFKAKFAATGRFNSYINAQTIADAIKNKQPLTSLVQSYTSNAQQMYQEAVNLYRYTYCNIKSTLRITPTSSNALGYENLIGTYPMTSPANYPAQAGGSTAWDDRSLATSIAYGNSGAVETLNVWRRINAQPSSSNPNILKPVVTIEGYMHGGDEYLCGFTQVTLETEGNLRQSHVDINFNSGSQMLCPLITPHMPKISMDVQVDYVMPDINYVSY